MTGRIGAPWRLWGRFRPWLPMFLVAAVVRIAYWVVITPTYVPEADSDQYRRLGRTLAAGRGFELVYPQLRLHPTAFRPPLYPLVLAPTFKLFGRQSLWPARLTSVILGSLVVVLAGVLAARIGGRKAGLVAAAAVALYPPLVANDTIVMTEALALLLLLTAFLLVDERRWAAAGITTGLLMLTRPNVYLVIAVFAIWLWRTIGWRRAAAYVGCAFVVVLPWMIRNQVQVGTWRLTTSDGLTIAGMYGPPAREANDFVDPVFSDAYSDAEHRFAQFDEATWSDKLTEEAVRDVKAHPERIWQVVRQNFRGYFELTPALNRFPEDSDGRNWRFRQDTLVTFFVVTPIGLAGLWLARSNPRTIALVAIVAQFVTLSLLLVAPPRLRAPFDLAMCIGVGLVVAEALRRWRPEGATVDEDQRSEMVCVAADEPVTTR